MRRQGRHGERVAGLDGTIRDAFHPERTAAIEDVADFDAGMGMRGDEVAGVDVDLHLQSDHRVAGEVLAVEDRAREARAKKPQADERTRSGLGSGGAHATSLDIVCALTL